MRCYRWGCQRDASHHIGFRAWGEGEVRNEKTALRGIIPQPLCAKHAREAHVGIIFTPEGWASLKLSITSRGRPAPTRDTVLIYPVEGAPPEPKSDDEQTRQ